VHWSPPRSRARALYLVGAVALGSPPGATDSPIQVSAWFRDHHDAVRVYAWTAAFGTLAFAVVAGVIRGMLPAPFGDVFLLGAGAFIIETAVQTWLWAGLALHPGLLAPSTARRVLDVASFWGPILTGATTTMIGAVTVLGPRRESARHDPPEQQHADEGDHEREDRQARADDAEDGQQEADHPGDSGDTAHDDHPVGALLANALRGVAGSALEIGHGCSARLRVALQATEVQQHTGLVSDDPRVVARRHVERVARAELALGAVVHQQRHAALKDVADVLDLAGVRARDRLDVLRPAPAGLEGPAADRMPIEVDELDPTHVRLELPHLVGALESLAGKLCHVVLLTMDGGM
jgi:hypothetical protein